MPLTIKTYPTGDFQTNCYFVVNEENECLIIDPGCDDEFLINELKEGGMEPKAILLTHAHFDHVSAVKALVEGFKIPVHLHPNDTPLYESPMNCYPPTYPVQERVPALDLLKISGISGFEFRVLHTPGHTQGGCCILFPEENIMFTGDTLFNQSIGRTDLPGGDHEQLIESIQTHLMTLNDDITIYPGHGPSSTIGFERKNNPYIS